MKALFNCSVIKNVYLQLESSPIELQITDNQNKTWMCKKSIDIMYDRHQYKEKYEKAYNTVKQALLNKEPFVEIELDVELKLVEK